MHNSAAERPAEDWVSTSEVYVGADLTHFASNRLIGSKFPRFHLSVKRLQERQWSKLQRLFADSSAD